MNLSDQTAANPSDRHPPCPECDSDVYVDGVNLAKRKYKCQLCDEVFTYD